MYSISMNIRGPESQTYVILYRVIDVCLMVDPNRDGHGSYILIYSMMQVFSNV